LAIHYNKVKRLDGSIYDIISEYVLQIYPLGSKEVIIARGDLAADSIASVAYAQARGLPIILVEPNEIPPVIQSTLNQLGVQKAVVLGGSTAVSNEVVGNLPESVRIAGLHRYETAVKIAEALISIKEVDTIVITDGENIDTTSVMVAVYFNAPILYSKGTELTPETRTFLEKNEFKRIVFVGVPKSIENEITEIS
jgi:putative cell wall-binding protein